MTTKRKPTKPTAKAEIYALIDPRDGAIRYIGKANNSAKRLVRHLSDSRRRDTPVYRWIRKLAEIGLKPSFCVLEVCDDWIEAERRLISEARSNGERLLNVADGGDQPYCSPEVRSRIGFKVTKQRAICLTLSQLSRNLRAIKRSGDVVRAKRHTDIIAHIRERIEIAKKEGWIDRMEAGFTAHREALKNGEGWNSAREKGRQAITLQG